MSKIRGEKVPSYRLTKEQKDFQKKVAKLMKVRRLLEAKTLQLKVESQNVTDLWLQLRKQFKLLRPPQESVKEVEGMDFAENNMM